MPARFVTPQELSKCSEIPYLQVLRWIKENKVVLLRDSQNRALINVNMFMSALIQDLDIGYTIRGKRTSRRLPIEPLVQDQDDAPAAGAPQSTPDDDLTTAQTPDTPRRTASGRRRPETTPAPRTRTARSRPNGSASAPVSS